jgi:hypothetical protein
MLINIEYQNGERDMISDFMLDPYIKSGKMRRFKRRDGWVDISIDPTRGKGGTYQGPDRRKAA